MLWLCYTCLQCHSTAQSQRSGDKDGYQAIAPFPSFLPILLMEGVFTADYVRGELVAVFAAVTTNVALQWISVSVATHVDGVHDMVQEEHPTVLALEGPQLLALSSEHLHPSLARGPLHGHSHYPSPHSCPASGRRFCHPLTWIDHRWTTPGSEAGRGVAAVVALPLLRAAASRVSRVESTVVGRFLLPFLGRLDLPVWGSGAVCGGVTGEVMGLRWQGVTVS